MGGSAKPTSIMKEFAVVTLVTIVCQLRVSEIFISLQGLCVKSASWQFPPECSNVKTFGTKKEATE